MVIIYQSGAIYFCLAWQYFRTFSSWCQLNVCTSCRILNAAFLLVQCISIVLHWYFYLGKFFEYFFHHCKVLLRLIMYQCVKQHFTTEAGYIRSFYLFGSKTGVLIKESVSLVKKKLRLLCQMVATGLCLLVTDWESML